MAASSRSTFGTATGITAMLRVLYSRMATPRAGGPAAYSFNVPSASGQGAIEVNGTKEVRRFERTGGMCPECEGTGRGENLRYSVHRRPGVCHPRPAAIYFVRRRASAPQTCGAPER
ncbi:hypothetical protein [Corynebacterium sp. MSK195]|uniref:hypothetical protein n=1 Tax=Corynebacterium sp. MSK195 TaxID=3050216 RepID=UPI0033076CE3